MYATVHALSSQAVDLPTVGSTDQAPSAAGSRPPIGWNFESFLMTREGEMHTRWKTGVDLTAPQQTEVIELLLADKVEL